METNLSTNIPSKNENFVAGWSGAFPVVNLSLLVMYPAYLLIAVLHEKRKNH